MSNLATIDISEVERVFNCLNEKQLKSLLNPAIRKVLNPIIKDAQVNFRMDFNRLSHSTKQHAPDAAYKSLLVSPYRKTIGMGAGASIRGKNQGYYARFLNDGTAERFRKTKKGRVSTGKITAKPFFSDAVKGNESNIESSLEDNVIRAIERMIKKGKA